MRRVYDNFGGRNRYFGDRNDHFGRRNGRFGRRNGRFGIRNGRLGRRMGTQHSFLIAFPERRSTELPQLISN